MPINYQRMKDTLDDWFKTHDETSQYWKDNKENYEIICEMLNKQGNDNSITISETNARVA